MASASWQPAKQRDRVFPVVWLRAALVATIATLVGVALLLATRRCLGAFTAPMPLASSLPAVVVAASFIWATRALWRRLRSADAIESPASETFLAWGGSFAIIALFAACALPSPQVFDLALWLPVIVLDQFHRQAFLGALPRDSLTTLPARRAPLLEWVESPLDAEVEEDGALIVQQLRRIRDDTGTESIHGMLRAEFVVGQRHAILHAGFCPPMARLPVVEAVIGDGPDAVVRVVQAFAHGVRLEVRLAEPTDEPCAVIVKFSAAPRGETLAV